MPGGTNGAAGAKSAGRGETQDGQTRTAEKAVKKAQQMQQVTIRPKAVAKFQPLVGGEVLRKLESESEDARQSHLWGTIWNINSTAAGGGVAEMLQTILGYASDLGINVRWLVMDAEAHFYEITKRIHNGIHGSPGDGGLLGKNEHETYRRVADRNLTQLKSQVVLGDVVVLHDPQTAGLINGLKRLGVHVIWRSHIGHDHPNDFANRSWTFLRPYLEEADAWCFSRASYAPSWLPRDRVYTIAPSIDPFSPKNQEMTLEVAQSIVAHLGIITPPHNTALRLTYQKSDETISVIKRHADIVHSGPLPDPSSPLVVQVSRWDRLKDMEGVMRGFADIVPEGLGAHLALVGPNVHGVSDDPEGAATFDHCLQTWRELPHFKRSKVHLVCLPMHDIEENAAMVNAIQRHAAVIVQKSLYEGFGLTVTEAMWKRKAVIASWLGGIQDQIDNNRTGCLIKDPTNLTDFGETLVRLLSNHEERDRLGLAAHQSVAENFLAPRHLLQYAAMIRRVVTKQTR